MSAGDTHALKLSEGELINSPVLDSLCSVNIDTKYVFVFLKYNYYFEYHAVDGYIFFMHIFLKSNALYL